MPAAAPQPGPENAPANLQRARETSARRVAIKWLLREETVGGGVAGRSRGVGGGIGDLNKERKKKAVDPPGAAAAVEQVIRNSVETYGQEEQARATREERAMAEEYQRNALADKSRLDAMKTNKERKKAVDSPDRAGPSSAASPRGTSIGAEEHMDQAAIQRNHAEARAALAAQRAAEAAPGAAAGPSSAAGPSRPRPYDDDELDV